MRKIVAVGAVGAQVLVAGAIVVAATVLPLSGAGVAVLIHRRKNQPA